MLKKILSIGSGFIFLPVLANSLSVTYASDKLAQCSVTMEYFDGGAGRVTCQVQDTGSFRAAGTSVTLACDSEEQVNNLTSTTSAVLIK